jgi:hypothetical protein
VLEHPEARTTRRSLMATTSLADHRHQSTDERAARWRAIKERTTRGLLTYNSGKVHRLQGDAWAVPSTRGGFHVIDLMLEVCDCEDFTYFGANNDVACRHIVAAAVAREKRARMQRATLRHLEERLAHELLDDEDRQELRDRVLALRRRLRRSR